ncbi:MAG TPA: hypothetical protein VMJ90_00265 [Anaerolineales bacterium]|nr:hypothetical protein [Anaerolineales bacterium]
MTKKNSKPAEKGKRAAKPLPGITLERAVARVQEMLDPNSKVTHNEMLEDRLGNSRQFDVVIRGTFGGLPVLGVVECKDHNRKKNPDVVEAFAKKCENVGAHLKIMVSRLGFTKQALRVAGHENIVCLSLLPGDYGQTGLKLNMTAYAQIWEWTDIKLALESADIPLGLAEYNADDVLFKGQPVLDLFLKELATTHVKEKTLGVLKRVIEFDAPVELSIKGRRSKTQRVRFRATRTCAHKRKQLQLFGDGVYDWQNDKWIFPKGGQIFGSEWKGDYSDWEDYNGTIPPDSSEPFRCMVVLYRLPRPTSDTIPENVLGAIYENPIAV